MIRKILVPIDLSADNLDTVRFAADMARRYNASLTVLHVQQSSFPHAPQAHGFARSLADAARKLAAAKQEAFATGIQDVELLLLPGGASEKIVHVAAEHGYDVIVMGRRGRSGCDRLLFGSVTESVLRKAPCPVVCIRLPEPVSALTESRSRLPNIVV